MPEFREFIVEYTFHGSAWLVTVMARDPVEARARLMRAGTHGKVTGTLVGKIHAAPGAGLLTRAICAARNLFKRSA